MSRLKRPLVVIAILFVIIQHEKLAYGATLNESNGSSRHASSLIHNTVATKEMHIDESLSHRHTADGTTTSSTATTDDSSKKSKGHQESNHLLEFLADMKSGTKVFQHFFMHSNLTQIVEGTYKNVIRVNNKGSSDECCQ